MDQYSKTPIKPDDMEKFYPFHLSPDPFYISSKFIHWLKELGDSIHAFYQACNNLYYRSISDPNLKWVLDYLEQGKPAKIIEVARAQVVKTSLPGIMRPDILLGEFGHWITELDAVPGGIGITAFLRNYYPHQTYSDVHHEFSLNDMAEGFAQLLMQYRPYQGKNINLAILISDESQFYYKEMEYLIQQLSNKINIKILTQEELLIKQDGVYYSSKGKDIKLDVLYRFFELFDIDSIKNNSGLIEHYLNENIVITPPLKPFLEEKIWLSLFYHPELCDFWASQLGETVLLFLKQTIPKTWIVEPQKGLSAYDSMKGFEIDGHPISSWEQLKSLSKKQRHLVLKISGFSNIAWGGRGVFIGHHLKRSLWRKKVDAALDSFSENPWVCQHFLQRKQFETRYYDSLHNIQQMSTHALLRPYYYVYEGQVHLRGIQVVSAPLNMKKIHITSGSIVQTAYVDDLKAKFI